jgi:hypothetical protein
MLINAQKFQALLYSNDFKVLLAKYSDIISLSCSVPLLSGRNGSSESKFKCNEISHHQLFSLQSNYSYIYGINKLSACLNSRTDGWIFNKFDIRGCYKKLII